MDIHSHKVQNPLKTVFLDRDGTLIEDAHYLRQVQDVRGSPGVPEALLALQNHGYQLVVVSNQSCLARGYFNWTDLKAVQEAMEQYLETFGVHIAGWYYCPHLPEVDGPCLCRKPSNGLLEQAIAELGLAREGSWMVGDSLRDVEAGHKSGVSGVLVQTGKTIDPKTIPPSVRVYPDFPSFVRVLLNPGFLG